jgi:hypothetical protein
MVPRSKTADEATVRRIVAEVMGIAPHKLTRETMVLVEINPDYIQSARIWDRLRREHGVPIPDDCISFGSFRKFGDLADYAAGSRSREEDSYNGLQLVEMYLESN